MNSEARSCQNCKQDFRIETEDFNFYQKMQVPPPTWCPGCRLERRMAWRNERVLFRRKDDMSGAEMLCGFPRETPFPVYERDYWFSDAWDPLQYGRDYDFSRPFFEQLRELMHAVPWAGKSTLFMTNSDYCDQAGHIKNCYLCFNCDYLEECSYVVRGNNVKDSLDLLHAEFSELSYESVRISKGFRNFFSLDCADSTDLWFSKNCVGCTNCFGCVNLRKKSYHIWNEPYTKEAYEAKLKEMNLGSYASREVLQQQAQAFWGRFPVKFSLGIRNVHSSGDMLNDTKNARGCFAVGQGENLKYCQYLYLGTTDSYDYTVWGNRSSQMYECLTCGEESDSLKFSFDCWPSCRALEYCLACHSSSDLFGCVGLKKKQYCIFNKQYSREEYETLRKKIIEHMHEMPYVTQRAGSGERIVYRYGEFFPTEFSPFAYNETMLQDAFPLTKEEAQARGYRWREIERRKYEATVAATELPDHINDVREEILKEIVSCSTCELTYRITQSELNFLRRMGLALPRMCPNCRVVRRFGLVNVPRFYNRGCSCAGSVDFSDTYRNVSVHLHGDGRCANTFETSYAPDRNEIVYCESCYQAEVV